MSRFDPAKFRISENDHKYLDVFYSAYQKAADSHLGYPANTVYDYADLHRFFAFTINNAGDPFAEGIYKLHTHTFERDVVSFFAKLFHAPSNAYWGYVTNGGTESNLYALWLAREYLPDGIVYFSDHAHYSIPKALRAYGMTSVSLKTLEDGEMDYADLETKLGATDRPPIIVATIGTTMNGAVDQVQKIVDVLKRKSIKKFYIHCDAALGGMLLPFIEDSPLFDFRLPIGSISISGHKMIGSPVPCGIIIARKEHVDRVARFIELIGAPDTTISGSRNGHSVLFLWYAIRRFGIEGFRSMVRSSLEVKEHALERLAAVNWPASTNNYSVTVVIKRPPRKIVRKWQLAVGGETAHLVVMPNVTKAHIDAFIADLSHSSPLGKLLRIFKQSKKIPKEAVHHPRAKARVE